MKLAIRPLTPDLWPALEDGLHSTHGPALQAYPFDSAVSPSASGCGYASTFARAGFKIVARRSPARPITRHD